MLNQPSFPEVPIVAKGVVPNNVATNTGFLIKLIYCVENDLVKENKYFNILLNK